MEEGRPNGIQKTEMVNMLSEAQSQSTYTADKKRINNRKFETTSLLKHKIIIEVS